VKDDEGQYSLENLLILAPFQSEQDIEDGRTSLSIDMEHGALPENDGFFGSKYLLYTIPEVSTAIIETAPVVIQATYDTDIKEYHKGNNVGITDAHLATACTTSIDNCNSAYAQAIDEKTKKPRLVTYRLKVPEDPITGEQIYVHSHCWQGESWSSRHDGSSGELKESANIAGFEETSQRLTSNAYEKVIGMLTYRVAIVGNEQKDLHRIINSSPVTKKLVDRLQASRIAKAAQDQAKACNRGGHPNTTATSSTTHHHRNNPTMNTVNPHNPTTHRWKNNQQNQYNTSTHQTNAQHQNQHYAHQNQYSDQQNHHYSTWQNQYSTKPASTKQNQYQNSSHRTNTYMQPFTQTEHTSNQQDQYHQLDPFNTETEHTTTQQDQYPYNSTYTGGGDENYEDYNDPEDEEHLISMASSSQQREDQKAAWKSDGTDEQAYGMDKDPYYKSYADRLNDYQG
jgi:hypothetical protein